jgi:hypothetical protein
MPQRVTGYGKAALARYLMRAELYPLEHDPDATLTGRGKSPTALHLTGRGGVKVTQTFSGASSGQSKGMNAAEILASVAGVLEKAQGWSDEQKLSGRFGNTPRLETGRPSRTGSRRVGVCPEPGRRVPSGPLSTGPLRLGDSGRPLNSLSTAYQTTPFSVPA